MKKKRIDYIDYAKGFAILCVLLGHMEISPILKHSIYSFHMPLFFILSGYFLRKGIPDKDSIKKNFQALLVPYLVVAGGMCVWQLFSNYDAFTKLETSTLASLLFVGYRVRGEDIICFVGAIWFLWVLFLSKIYTQYMLKWKYGGGYYMYNSHVLNVIHKNDTYCPPFRCITVFDSISIFISRF